MKKHRLIYIFLIAFPFWTNAQFQQFGQNQRPENNQFGRRGQENNSFNPIQQGSNESAEDPDNGSQQPQVPREVKNWKLRNGFSIADTIAVDTISTGFQIYNPVYQNSIVNVYTGNLGAPAQSALIEDMPIHTDFLFSKNLNYWLTGPEDWKYYNTRTPYTNLYYQHSGPKRRSEENVGVLFTQNVNKNLNVGFNYKIISSVGKYQAQKAENRLFRLFSSYSGEKYSVHGSFFYGKTDQFENGGILNDDNIIHPERYDYDEPENIQVIFMDASNRIDNYKLFLDQKFKTGNITLPVNDTTSKTVPLATLSHTFELDRAHRTYKIDNLDNYFPEGEEPVFYRNRFNDVSKTRDSVFQTTIRNTFQIKFNEEANPFLRFGMRAYLTNEIENLRWPAPSVFIEGEGEENDQLIYHKNREQRSATALGGQLFKNLGKNFFYDAGLRVWFQGHKAGDSEITGNLNSLFRIGRDTAGVFARGGLFLISPDFFTEQYYSNHFQWKNRFDQTKTIKIHGGITVPTRKLELSGEIRLLNDHIFWNENALPEQTNTLLNIYQLKLKKHFKLWNLHSRNEVAYQLSSHSKIVPLPELALFSSNYFENTLFQVLFFQIGFDVRFHTEYYAKDYMPATGQFFIQRERKIGNYPVIDPFANFHLKRANIFVKYSHLNQGFPNNNYFHTIGFPINPRGVRFGVSWNFYD